MSVATRGSGAPSLSVPVIVTASAVRVTVTSSTPTGEPRLDLAYEEDSAADVDFNFVMTDAGQFIEIQGTAEGEPFSADDYAKLVALASVGAKQLFSLQQKALEAAKLP